MNRFMRYVLLILLLSPCLGIAMESIYEMQKEIRRSALTTQLDWEPNSKEITPVLGNFEPVGDSAYNVLKNIKSIPEEIWKLIWEKLEDKDKRSLGSVLKVGYPNIFQGMFLYTTENRLREIVNDRISYQQSPDDMTEYMDIKFHNLLILTEVLEEISNKAELTTTRDKNFAVIIGYQENARSFLQEFRENKGNFLKQNTEKYENDYIYLSKVYNNYYEPNCCCLPCCTQMRNTGCCSYTINLYCTDISGPFLFLMICPWLWPCMLGNLNHEVFPIIGKFLKTKISV